MRLQDVEDDLPILLFYYDEVVQRLENPLTKSKRKIPRKAALDRFLETRSFKQTAREFGVSPATINEIVYRAFRLAREFAGVTRTAAAES